MSFVNFGGKGEVNRLVAGNDAPEGGYRVTGKSSSVCFNHVSIAAKSARVSVLDDSYSRVGEIAGCAPGSFEVKEVIEGELRPAQLRN